MNTLQTQLLPVMIAVGLLPLGADAAVVTYLPYIQPGDAGQFGPSDQIVVSWQTDEATPDATAYAVLVAEDPSFKKATHVAL